MPNWCSNILFVTGKREEIDKFKVAFKGKQARWGVERYQKKGKTKEEIAFMEQQEEQGYMSQEDDYCFNALVPVPDSVLRAGYSEQGYTWCVENWGCKWDISDVHVGDDYDFSLEEEFSFFSFSTPWGPPTSFVAKVSEQFPNLTFRIVAEEDGMVFGLEAIYEGGELLSWLEAEQYYREFVIDKFGYDPYEDFESVEEPPNMEAYYASIGQTPKEIL